MAMGWCQAIGQRIPRPAVAILTKNPQNHPLAVEKKRYFIGAACNVKRWIRREVWKLQQAARAVAAEAASLPAN